MAIRSSAGTGVTISLVVFVLLTVLLLAGSILLWGKLQAAQEEAAKADENLSSFVRLAERNAPWFQRLETSHGRDTLMGHLNDRYEALRQFTFGNSDASFPDLAAARTQAGLAEGGSMASAVADATRRIADLTAANAALTARTANAEQDRDRLDKQLQEAGSERDALLAAESEQLKGYTEADSRHATAIQKAVSDFGRMQATARDQLNGTISEQQDEVDRLTKNNKMLSSKLRDLDARLNRDRLNATNPAALVDGTILDIVGGGDMVYIDRGRNDQIVLGMTFEVYESADQIQAESEDENARGKASIQVIKIGDASATAKVIRRVKGRPVTPGNVITNAIYDPEYKFRFLVHGKYDLDHDGKATLNEAQYLRDRISRWGGEVVTGTEIPGDLDFLVLGTKPRNPIQPGVNQRSTEAMNEYRRLRTAVDTYQALLHQAQQARIPVLNQTRLEILTGRTDL
ncbi:MAG: hypothetical protein GY894_06490 [Planctomycetes bacterium]|jgi:uncharacterized coiled-coil protein SlyX|nr:hypothetical protein [Planctomycetota bacterium]